MDNEKVNGDISNENPNLKKDAINDNIKLFNRLQNLQTLIKKESSLKELCKNHI